MSAPRNKKSGSKAKRTITRKRNPSEFIEQMESHTHHHLPEDHETVDYVMRFLLMKLSEGTPEDPVGKKPVDIARLNEIIEMLVDEVHMFQCPECAELHDEEAEWDEDEQDDDEREPAN